VHSFCANIVEENFCAGNLHYCRQKFESSGDFGTKTHVHDETASIELSSSRSTFQPSRSPDKPNKKWKRHAGVTFQSCDVTAEQNTNIILGSNKSYKVSGLLVQIFEPTQFHSSGSSKGTTNDTHCVNTCRFLVTRQIIAIMRLRSRLFRAFIP
jgi:hypothetical protein